jgi:hypothetical protein
VFAAVDRAAEDIKCGRLQDLVDPDATATPILAKPQTAWDRELASALADVRAKLDATAAGTRAPIFDLDAVDLLAHTFEGHRWLVRDLITRLGVAVIGGEPKAAKTWLATELALAIATGTRACGHFYADAGAVAYFYAEDLDVQVRNRMRALLAGADRRLARGRLFARPRALFLDVLRDEDLAWIVASVRKLGVQLDALVLDPLRDLHSGEEDKSDSMRDVMRRMRVLVELLGCTIIVIHHAAKATKETAKRRPGQNLRGSGAIHGSVDSGVYLEESGGDETNLFTNTVRSQVKGARSAGRFALELAVIDDENGEAVAADWIVRRDAPAPAARKTTPNYRDNVVRAARECAAGFESKTAIVDAVGGYRQRVFAAIDEELGPRGRLEYRGGRIVAREVQP